MLCMVAKTYFSRLSVQTYWHTDCLPLCSLKFTHLKNDVKDNKPCTVHNLSPPVRTCLPQQPKPQNPHPLFFYWQLSSKESPHYESPLAVMFCGITSAPGFKCVCVYVCVPILIWGICPLCYLLQNKPHGAETNYLWNWQMCWNKNQSESHSGKCHATSDRFPIVLAIKQDSI